MVVVVVAAAAAAAAATAVVVVVVVVSSISCYATFETIALESVLDVEMTFQGHSRSSKIVRLER